MAQALRDRRPCGAVVSLDFGNTWKKWYLIEDIIKNEN